MTIKKNVFWDDLDKDLKDPEQMRLFLLESIRISTFDSLVNTLNQVRDKKGYTKAEVARQLGSEPANVRRFFIGGTDNPTLSTLTEVAAALGMRLSLEPLPTKERQEIAKILTQNTNRSVSHSTKSRQRTRSA